MSTSSPMTDAGPDVLKWTSYWASVIVVVIYFFVYWFQLADTGVVIGVSGGTVAATDIGFLEALAGLLAAMRHLDRKLSEQKIVFFGAGSASVGIADMICAGMTDEGLPSMEEARQRVWLVDSRGLVTHRREGELQSHKIPYATDDEPAVSLLDVVERIKPTIIIGASGQPQTFTREVLSAMYRSCDRPIVFALSNPTSKSECTAEQADQYRGIGPNESSGGWSRGATVPGPRAPPAPGRPRARRAQRKPLRSPRAAHESSRRESPG